MFLVFFVYKYTFILLLVFPYRFFKIVLKKNKELKNYKMAFLYGFFTFIANWPQLEGHILFLKRRIMHGKIRIIEHK